MADKLKFQSIDFFANGQSGASSVVGKDGNTIRVVRYKFRTSAVGANKVSWTMLEAENGNGSVSINNELLRFYIGTDPNSHINAGADATYHGVATATKVGSLYTVAAEADNLILLPDTDYYLFIFPGYTTSGWWGWWQYSNEMYMYLEGAAGLVRIGDDVITQPYIHDGTEWKLSLPYLNENENWKICG